MTTIRLRLRSTNSPETPNAWDQSPKWTLLDLLPKTWNFEATDKRDKGYAVTGLLEFSAYCLKTTI